jgi:hypothetical protein
MNFAIASLNYGLISHFIVVIKPKGLNTIHI